MHIILSVLGAIVTILVLVKKLSDAGIDIGWLNPFTWRRRRAWRKKFEGNPVFTLDGPLEVAAMLATALAKIDGEISREEKATLLSLFQSEFRKTEKEASELLLSSIYIFGDGQEALKKPASIMKRSLDKFTEEQARSVMSLLDTILKIDATNVVEKEKFISEIETVFSEKFGSSDEW